MNTLPIKKALDEQIPIDARDIETSVTDRIVLLSRTAIEEARLAGWTKAQLVATLMRVAAEAATLRGTRR